MIALLLSVFGVQAVFAGLGMVSAQMAASPPARGPGGRRKPAGQEPGSSQPEDAGSAQSAPSFCPFCGEGLPSSFQWGQFCPYCGERVEP